MRRYGRRCGAGALVLGLAMVVPQGPRAHAQEPSSLAAPPDAPQESSQYLALVDAALDEFSRGNWTEAYALFVQAHALEPSARTLRGLAACAFEARQYLRAIEFMRAALVDPRKPLSPEQRHEAERLIERARVFVARLTVAIEPSGARVELATPAQRDDQDRVLLDPGVHQITFSHPNYLTETRTVSVNPGDTLHLSLQLVRASEHDDSDATPQPLPSTQPARRASTTDVDLRTWAWITAAASVAFAGAGATFFMLGKDAVDDVEGACPPGACSRAQIDRLIERESLVELQAGSILGFALAGAGAIASTILFASSVESADGAGTSPTALLAPAPGGAALQARF
jgi:hypothetical protein